MPSNLVILPCHAIWKGGACYGESAQEWHLVDFQKVGYDHLAFKNHITQSVSYLKENSDAYLVISGGQTKAELGPVSESLSYYQLARTLYEQEHFFEEVKERITTEEFARDSFENVLFLICRFYEVFQRYPERITIVGFEFKRARFLDHHLHRALRFPLEKVEYIGNSPDPKDLDQERRQKYFEDLDNSEYKFAVKHFDQDWYGINAPLATKKMGRNPYNRHHGYQLSNPAIALFLSGVNGSIPVSNEQLRSLLQGVPWIKE